MKKKDIKVLFIAYYFPPESSSGAFRPLYFANYLDGMGCQIRILTSKEKYYLDEQPIDNALLDRLNCDIKVIRTKVSRPREALISFKKKLFPSVSKDVDKNNSESPTPASGDKQKPAFQSVKDCITDLLALPDPHVGWLPWAVLTGRKIIGAQHIDVIWATGSPWSCFLVGALLKKLTGKPLVLDYRDPWGTNPNMRLKNKFVATWEQKLEKIVVHQADLITANTKELRDDFLTRFSFLRRNKVITLSNGFERFIEAPVCKNKALTLTHAGAVYFSRNPINLLMAVRDLLNEGVIPHGGIKIKFVGGISIDDPALHTLLALPELKSVVEIYPRMSFDEAIEHQLASDILFLLQPGFPLQVPRKLYDYVSLQKPILAITDQQGATARLVQENHFGVVVADVKNDLKCVLKKMWLQWQDGNLPQPSSENGKLFLNSNISATLYDNLAALVDGSSENVAS